MDNGGEVFGLAGQGFQKIKYHKADGSLATVSKADPDTQEDDFVIEIV